MRRSLQPIGFSISVGGRLSEMPPIDEMRCRMAFAAVKYDHTDQISRHIDEKAKEQPPREQLLTFHAAHYRPTGQAGQRCRHEILPERGQNVLILKTDRFSLIGCR